MSDVRKIEDTELANISGGGSNRDEEVIITFDAPAEGDSIVLQLDEVELGNGLDDKDDPIIFVRLTDGTKLAFDETQYTFTPDPSEDKRGEAATTRCVHETPQVVAAQSRAAAAGRIQVDFSDRP